MARRLCLGQPVDHVEYGCCAVFGVDAAGKFAGSYAVGGLVEAGTDCRRQAVGAQVALRQRGWGDAELVQTYRPEGLVEQDGYNTMSVSMAITEINPSPRCPRNSANIAPRFWRRSCDPRPRHLDRIAGQLSVLQTASAHKIGEQAVSCDRDLMTRLLKPLTQTSERCDITPRTRRDDQNTYIAKYRARDCRVD